MAFELQSNKLSEHLKPLDNQVDLGKDAPFPNSNFLYLLIGGVGSGKTTLALSLLKIDKNDGGFRKQFNKIYVVSPTAKYDPKFEKLIDEVDEDGNYYRECDDENIQEIIEKIENFNEEWKMKRKKANRIAWLSLMIVLMPSQKRNQIN